MDKKVYVIDINISDNTPDVLSDGEFKRIAELQKTVHTLQGFTNLFNQGEINDEHFIRFI